MNLAANLKHLRKKLGKTQDALSAELNIGRTTLANYEAGISEPNIDTLRLFANFFGITLDALVSGNLEKGGAGLVKLPGDNNHPHS
ncbi:MAG: XRE family transcriptional regulator, partial [Chitinophagia bacterium]|nr:XRE family transcriptional regulator [Chitinophagia bacterium]